MIARVVVALCAALPLAALAFSSTPSGNQTTYSGFNAGSGNIGKYAVSTASDGRVLINSGARLTVAGGGSIPINVTGSIPRASAAAAVGRFLRKGVPVVGTAVALYALAQELGFTIDNSSGTPAISQQLNTFSWKVPNGTVIATNASTPNAGWTAYINDMYGTGKNPACVAIAQHAGGYWYAQCTSTFMNQVVTSFDPITGTSTVTVEQFEDAVATKSGWPTSSQLANTVREALVAGDALAVESPVVTGPATAPVSTTTTVDPATGNTTTTIVQISNTYDGPTVTTTTTQTTTVTNTTTGAPVGEPVTTVTGTPVTPTTETPTEVVPFAMPCGVPGTPPCEVSVDETGMKTPDQIKNDQADNTLDQWDSFVTGIIAALPAFPTINWAFSLPTACGVIPLPAFEPMLSSIDVCQFQPMFHELMTVVWMLGGLFGAISLFMRSSLSN